MSHGPVSQAISALPTNWWLDVSACHTFARLFSRHILALQMVFRYQGKEYHDLYSGFATYYRNRLMWITAGHVIDEITERASNPKLEIGAAGWLDGCEVSGAESVPAGNLKELVSFSASPL